MYLLKLDFEKVYDRVDWGCLQEVLKHRCFETRWIAWIDKWLKSAKCHIMLNGECTREIVCRHGLCQGDPLSPLLFCSGCEWTK